MATSSCGFPDVTEFLVKSWADKRWAVVRVGDRLKLYSAVLSAVNFEALENFVEKVCSAGKRN